MNAGSLTVTGASNLNGGADLNGNKITSVANGTVATDAVNFGQLKTTNNNVNNAQASANSAQTSANNAQTTATNAQTTATTALTEANKGFNIKAGSSTVDNVKLGETVGFTNTDSNLVVTNNATDNTVNYNLAQDIDLGPAGSVTTGNTVTNSAGVSITDGTNVTTMTSPGTTVTDVTNTSNYGAEGLTFLDTTGAVLANTPSITATGINAGDTVITNVASVGDITDTANANNAATAGDVNAAVSGATAAGLNFAGDSGTNVNRPLGSIFNITGGETDPANLTTGNIIVVANGTDGLSIQLAEAIDLGDDGSIKTGNTITNSDAVAITDGTVGGARLAPPLP